MLWWVCLSDVYTPRPWFWHRPQPHKNLSAAWICDLSPPVTWLQVEGCSLTQFWPCSIPNMSETERLQRSSSPGKNLSPPPFSDGGQTLASGLVVLNLVPTISHLTATPFSMSWKLVRNPVIELHHFQKQQSLNLPDSSRSFRPHPLLHKTSRSSTIGCILAHFSPFTMSRAGPVNNVEDKIHNEYKEG